MIHNSNASMIPCSYLVSWPPNRIEPSPQFNISLHFIAPIYRFFIFAKWPRSHRFLPLDSCCSDWTDRVTAKLLPICCLAQMMLVMMEPAAQLWPATIKVDSALQRFTGWAKRHLNTGWQKISCAWDPCMFLMVSRQRLELEKSGFYEFCSQRPED